MATATKKRGRKKKAKQGWLEGTEPPSHKDVDQAAENYFEVMQDRCKLSKEEDEAKTNLIEKMRTHGIERYETPDGLVVTIVNKSNVKCKKKEAEEESNAD